MHALAAYLRSRIGKFAVQVVPDAIVNDGDMVGQVEPGSGDQERNEDE